MRLIRNLSGISKLLLILLLVVAAVIGAFLSYMWTMGYYVSIGFKVPESPTITITNAAFPAQNTRLFNVTLLNPSFSPSSAIVNQIVTSTEDGVLHYLEGVVPPLSYELRIGESRTFECTWNWEDYTGETVGIHVFVAEGSGATFQKKVPLVRLTVTDVVFDPALLTNFNLTIQNSELSETFVDIMRLSITLEDGTFEYIFNTVPALPHKLEANSSVMFVCSWDWTDYRGENITITVETLQGYEITSGPYTTPE